MKKSGSGKRLKAKDLTAKSGKSPRGGSIAATINPCFKGTRGGIINPCFRPTRKGG
jgi:hypothetical protein